MDQYTNEKSFSDYTSAPSSEPERFQDEYRTFEFEAMTEVPTALAAYISHQYSFDL